MAWIESHQELAHHPKTKKLVRLLSLPLPAVIGHLHLLWWWAMDYAENGDLSKYDAGDIEDACHWNGVEGELLDALIKSRFIDEQDGRLMLHDWYDFVGRLLEKREQNKERKRKSRARHAPVTHESQEYEIDDRDSHRATEPNQTEPNQTINNTATTTGENRESNSSNQDSSSKLECLYVAYQRVFGFGPTPHQVDQLGRYIDDDGLEEEVVVRAIERAGLNGPSSFKLIIKILNDYAAAGAKTMAMAQAFDADFEARQREKERRAPQHLTGGRGNGRGKPIIAPIISLSQAASSKLDREQYREGLNMAAQLDGRPILTDEEFEIRWEQQQRKGAVTNA